MKPIALVASTALLAFAAGGRLLAAEPAMPGMSAPAPAAAPVDAAAPAPVDIVRSATDLPGPISRRAPATVKVVLETREVLGKLTDATSYRYWTFGGKVPGPMLRVRVGDTVEVTLHNSDTSMMSHNVDFHAVTGPGGGGPATLAEPGQTKGFTFKAMKPGLYVYHCATPMVSQHIANGMYGLILVEPEGGLPKVDHEFYVMQGEVYTDLALGVAGDANMSVEKLMAEQPEYYVMNGSFKALTGDKRMKVKVGETARIYFGVGGPNKTSSFHIIGEIFDHVYNLGSLTNPPLKDVQTVSVPPGGATVVDLKFEVPGSYIVVDHALSRVDRGDAAIIEVTGPESPTVYKAVPGTPTYMEH